MLLDNKPILNNCLCQGVASFKIKQIGLAVGSGSWAEAAWWWSWQCLGSCESRMRRYLSEISGGSNGKGPACNVGDLGLIPGVGRSPGGGHGNPLQYSCLEKVQWQRSLVGYSLWCLKESDATERLSTAQHSTEHSLSLIRVKRNMLVLCLRVIYVSFSINHAYPLHIFHLYCWSFFCHL